ncbi:hypothetical protein GGR57DRAFT_500051 [Xylariaceae sp. FL1272]|nr:hypothetical protein GGR57DRAFT_500051 [Xylariaceae sp. FL1272]
MPAGLSVGPSYGSGVPAAPLGTNPLPATPPRDARPNSRLSTDFSPSEFGSPDILASYGATDVRSRPHPAQGLDTGGHKKKGMRRLRPFLGIGKSVDWKIEAKGRQNGVRPSSPIEKYFKTAAASVGGPVEDFDTYSCVGPDTVYCPPLETFLYAHLLAQKTRRPNDSSP